MWNSPTRPLLVFTTLCKTNQETKCSTALTVLHFKQMKLKITSKAPVNTTIYRIIDLVAELLSNNTWYLWEKRVLPQKFSILPSNTLMEISPLHTALYVLWESVAIFRNRPPSLFFTVFVRKLNTAEITVNIKRYFNKKVRVTSLWAGWVTYYSVPLAGDRRCFF